MRFMTNAFVALSFALLLCSPCNGSNLADGFTQRQQQARDVELAKGTDGDLMILAYAGVNITAEMLNRTLDSGPKDKTNNYGIVLRETSDFAIIELIRIMAFSGKYDDIILPVLEQIPFWMNYGEKTRCYWSENHMAMWLTSSQLLHELYGWPLPDDNHRNRLIKLLEIKRDYGYYEFLSTTYFRFTLSAFLNLYDFSSDQELRDLAEAAVNRMIVDLMKVTNSRGAFFPVSGRSGNGAMIKPYGGSHQKCIAILTGLGEFPADVGGGSAFLATTSMNLTDAINTYTEVLNEPFDIGISLTEQDVIYDDQDRYDKVVFQWSQGAYFDASSNIAVDTFSTIKHFNMWESRFFKDYAPFRFLPSSLAGLAASMLNCLSGSSLLAADARIFKYKSTMLTSLQEYYPGLKGYQQHPLMSTTGTLTVFTQGGPPDPDFEDRPSLTLNPTFPDVKQVDNVALVLYNPHPDLSIMGFNVNGINLYWPEEDFHDVEEIDKWLFGRENESYVGVYRHCLDQVNTLWHCKGSHQLWAIVVGHEDLHGSFSNFTDIVSDATVQRSVSGSCVSGSIEVDNKSITNHEMCYPLLGGIGIAITVLSTYVVLQGACCFVCCRKKRRVWKKFHHGTKARLTGAVDVVQKTLGKEVEAKVIAGKTSPPEL